MNKQSNDSDPSIFLAKQMLEMKKQMSDPKMLTLFSKQLSDMKEAVDGQIKSMEHGFQDNMNEIMAHIASLSDKIDKNTADYTSNMDDLKKTIKDLLDD